MSRSENIHAFASNINKCPGCGACVNVCPVYRETGLESDSPRGKMAILKAMLAGQLTLSEVAENLEHCALCGLCASACPIDLPLKDIFLAARADFNKKKNSLGVVNALLSHPQLLSKLQMPLAAAQQLLNKSPWANNLPELEPFVYKEKEPVKGKKRVLLFPGCLAKMFYKNLASASVKALEANGYHVQLPPDLTCCGRQAILRDDAAAATKFCRQNLEILSSREYDILVTPCPGCLEQITKVWPEIYGLSAAEREQAKAVAHSAMDINSLLAQRKLAGNFPGKGVKKAVWHQPCLMGGKAAEAAKWLSGLSAGLSFLRNAPQTGCCGAPLKLHSKNNVKSNDLSEAIAQSRRDQTMAAGAEILVTGCPACVLQMRKTFAQNHDSVQVFHSLELYAQSLDK